ncbi:hypothetical protein [Rufibacter hautae]|uniref:Uncharacterized protein n=1 Tax=Rufibacter hautae TaxID=2595005 RepID=A0A5B6TB06_9BACT|nr:hypothetical protein [Rufibacter hautae]KAA3436184.1 hypothetical protein FOA19_17425 [Rufibacter hautae]
MAKYLLLGFFLLLGFISTCQAQTGDSLKTQNGAHRYLLLSKTGTLSRFRIYPGETITFKRFKDEGLRTQTLLDVRGNSFYIEGLEVPLKDVEKIRLRNHTGGRKVANFAGLFLKTAGTIFTLVGAVNTLTNLNDKADRQDGLQTMGSAVLLYAAGEGLHVLRKGTYTLNEKWTLKVMEMY